MARKKFIEYVKSSRHGGILEDYHFSHSTPCRECILCRLESELNEDR